MAESIVDHGSAPPEHMVAQTELKAGAIGYLAF